MGAHKKVNGRSSYYTSEIVLLFIFLFLLFAIYFKQRLFYGVGWRPFFCCVAQGKGRAVLLQILFVGSLRGYGNFASLYIFLLLTLNHMAPKLQNYTPPLPQVMYKWFETFPEFSSSQSSQNV